MLAKTTTTTAATGLLLLLAATIAATVIALTAAVPAPGIPFDIAASPQPATAPAPPSTVALADIPSAYLALYQQASTACPGLGWATLAAIGKIESDHGRTTLPGVVPGTENTAGAGGPMQFLAPTFAAVTARHPLPPGGATPASRYNPHDAIWAAAYFSDRSLGCGVYQ